MTWLWVITVLVALVAMALATALFNARRARLSARFEQVLYWRLIEALPECVILPQVTFSRFLRPAGRGLGMAHRRALQNQVAQKTVDYLVCLKDFTVVAAVELDDRSHSTDRDRRRDELLLVANIPVIRASVKDMPSVDWLRDRFTFPDAQL